MEPDHLNSLIEKYFLGIATEEERRSLLDWYRSSASHDVEWLMDEPNEDELVKKKMYNYIEEKTIPVQGTASIVHGFFYLNWQKVAAAAVFIILCFSIFHYKRIPTKAVGIAKIQRYKDHDHYNGTLASNKAVLTLADGSKVYLDDADTGQIAKQLGTSIIKTKAGELVYSGEAQKTVAIGEQAVYNTVSTPRGGKYKIVLPDGTTVWLNAASSLKYPPVFLGKERHVELTGEGYFEVAKNKEKPFKVTTPSPDGIGIGQTIEVLGTHFNINAYGDEGDTRTTLLEGSVKVSTAGDGQAAKVLRPGQQSIMRNRNLKIGFVDVESVVAWKNGYFVFNNESVSTIMSEISRWYDVDIYYDSPVDSIRLGGYISQDKKLPEVLDLLALTRKISFKTDGRRIIVMQ